MSSKIARASDSVWRQHFAADLPVPGGFDNWDQYDAWLDSVLTTGRHPDEPRSEPRRLDQRGPRSMEDVQRDEDLRILTHPHNGWTQTGPNTLEKTDWAGIHHKMTVGAPEDPVTLSSRYPEGAFTSYQHSDMRSADVAASRAGIMNILLPQLAEHGLTGFHNDQNYASAVRRDDDGWHHRITPFQDYRGHVWYSYSGGRSRPAVERTERDHPSLEAAVQHAMTRRPPE